jgi:hypothetical protein
VRDIAGIPIVEGERLPQNVAVIVAQPSTDFMPGELVDRRELPGRVAIDRVLDEVFQERVRQDEKWGEQNHPDGTGQVGDARVADMLRELCDYRFKRGVGTWRDILREEVGEALAEEDPTKLRAELLQVAAVAAAWVQAIDRRTAGG